MTGQDVHSGDVHRTTGPIMLKRAVVEYQRLSPEKGFDCFAA